MERSVVIDFNVFFASINLHLYVHHWLYDARPGGIRQCFPLILYFLNSSLYLILSRSPRFSCVHVHEFVNCTRNTGRPGQCWIKQRVDNEEFSKNTSNIIAWTSFVQPMVHIQTFINSCKDNLNTFSKYCTTSHTYTC